MPPLFSASWRNPALAQQVGEDLLCQERDSGEVCHVTHCASFLTCHLLREICKLAVSFLLQENSFVEMTLILICLGKIEWSGLFCFLFFKIKKKAKHVLEKEIILKLRGGLDRISKTGMMHKCSINVVNETFKKM